MTTGSCHYCFASSCEQIMAQSISTTRGEVVGHQVVGCQGSSTGLVINETGRRTTGSSVARATPVVTTETSHIVWYGHTKCSFTATLKTKTNRTNTKYLEPHIDSERKYKPFT